MNETATNHQQLEAYFHEYFTVLHRYAYTIVKDTQDAKDVVQGVFLELWEKKDLLRIQDSARSYLYSATHRRSLNFVRNQQTRSRYEQQVAGTWPRTTNLADQLDTQRLQHELLLAMESLPEKCRAIFYKSRFEEKKYAEIAAEMDISIKTVEAQMGKALRILRNALQGNQAQTLLLIALLTAKLTASL